MQQIGINNNLAMDYRNMPNEYQQPSNYQKGAPYKGNRDQNQGNFIV